MADVVRRLGIPTDRTSIIPNRAAEDIAPLAAEENPVRQSWGLSNDLVVGYAGNLGRAHDIETVIAAMGALNGSLPDEQAPSIRFLFVGGGALRATLECETKRMEFTNVAVHDYQPRDYEPGHEHGRYPPGDAQPQAGRPYRAEQDIRDRRRGAAREPSQPFLSLGRAGLCGYLSFRPR